LYPRGCNRNFQRYALDICDNNPHNIEIRIKTGFAEVMLFSNSSLSCGVAFLSEYQIKKTPNKSGSMIFKILIVVFFKN